MANAYSFGQVLPVEVVTNNNTTIVDLIERDFSVSVGAGLIDQWTTVEKNVYDVFPQILIDEPHEPEDTPNAPINTFEAFEGGFAYQVLTTYTTFVPVPPTLDETKGAAQGQALIIATNFLNGGVFFDDGGGNVLFDTDEFTRFTYAVIGIQANIIGDPFTITVRDSDFTQHFWNSAQWQAFFDNFFDLTIQARDELETAQLAIIAAVDEAGVQAALDAMSPPNDTL